MKDLREVYPDICILLRPVGTYAAQHWFWLARESGDEVLIGNLLGEVILRAPRDACLLTSGTIPRGGGGFNAVRLRREAAAEARRLAAQAERKRPTGEAADGAWGAFLDSLQGKE